MRRGQKLSGNWLWIGVLIFPTFGAVAAVESQNISIYFVSLAMGLALRWRDYLDTGR